MPLFPDAPEIVVPSTTVWAPGRTIRCDNEFEFAHAIWRLQGLEGFKNASANEDKDDQSSLKEACPNRGPSCGPNVTAQVVKVIALVRYQFAQWDAATQKSQCAKLTDAWNNDPSGQRVGGVCWDVVQLHHYWWIPLYAPSCANTPYCSDSVQVKGGCHYAGSVNYVMWGWLCKLCGMTPQRMVDFVMLHKGPIPPLKKGAPNTDASIAWSRAGYDGWGSQEGGNVYTPSGDRESCMIGCCIPYGPRPNPDKSHGTNGDPFFFHWMPYAIRESGTETIKGDDVHYR